MVLSKQHTGVILMLINVICWGAALPFVKPALEITTPFQHLFARYFIACLLTLPLLSWHLWNQPKLIKKIPTIISIELIGTILALGLLYEGLSRTTALEANIITTTVPFFIILGGMLFLRERQTKREWMGLFISLLGTIILIAQTGWNSLNVTGSLLITGNILLVLQNISEATFFLTAKKKYASLPKLFVTAISFWVGLIGFFLLGMLKMKLGPMSFIASTWHDFQQPAVSFAGIYMAIFGSIIGLTTYIAGQNLMEASAASIFRYLQPLVYIPLAVFLLKEEFTLITALALACIGIGVYLAEYKKSRTKKTRSVSRAG